MTKWTNLCWNKIDWKRVEFRNCRLQRQIYNASVFGKQKKVMFFQSIFICSLDAKLLAVHNFETLYQDRYFGLNQKFYSDASFKFRLAQKLKLEQKGDLTGLASQYLKQRHIEIKPIRRSKIIQDYVKQFWILMALEPQWKPLFESNSYGFRLDRNEHYTIKYLLNLLDTRSSQSDTISERFILKIDLRRWFNHMDHDYLLSKFHTPLIIKNQIQTWLKAGILTDFSSLKDSGSRIAAKLWRRNTIETTYKVHRSLKLAMQAFLCKVALHGIEQNLKSTTSLCDISEAVYLPRSFAAIRGPVHELERAMLFARNHSSKIQQSSIQFIHYIDNFLILHHDKEMVLSAKNEIFCWLKSNFGIGFSQYKEWTQEANISIQSSRAGFVFLGFRFIHIKSPAKTYRTKIYPSKKSQKEVIKQIGDFCRKNRSISTYDLISILSPIILNWANYFRFSECKAIFKKMDFLIFQILRAWVFRRDPRHGRMTIKSKYFPEGRTYIFDQRRYSDNWVLVGRQKFKNGKIDEKFLPKMAWVRSLKYQSLKT